MILNLLTFEIICMIKAELLQQQDEQLWDEFVISHPDGRFSQTAAYKKVLEAVGEKVSFRENISDHSEASNDVIEKLNSIYESLSISFETKAI